MDIKYEKAPVNFYDQPVTIYEYNNSIYLINLWDWYRKTPNMMWDWDRVIALMSVRSQFESDHPELMVVAFKPLPYGGDGDVFFYYMKCIPRNSTQAMYSNWA